MANKKMVIDAMTHEFMAQLKHMPSADYAALNASLVFDTIELISTISEMKDPYTFGHEKRCADLAYVIAQELGLDQSAQIQTYIAAHVHDIGKFAVPTEILVKPGRLMAEEFSLVKVHPAAGYKILKNIHFPPSWKIAQIVLQHHERCDGSGYPNALKDESILCESKIIAVADVVESMTCRRPYRAALGIDAALAEINQGRGVKYCDKVVDVTNKIFKDGFTF